jgi:hypothetical protein
LRSFNDNPWQLLVPLNATKYFIYPTAAAGVFVPIIGHGPGMSLAHVGGGLAGRANA